MEKCSFLAFVKIQKKKNFFGGGGQVGSGGAGRVGGGQGGWEQRIETFVKIQKNIWGGGGGGLGSGWM